MLGITRKETEKMHYTTVKKNMFLVPLEYLEYSSLLFPKKDTNELQKSSKGK